MSGILRFESWFFRTLAVPLSHKPSASPFPNLESGINRERTCSSGRVVVKILVLVSGLS